MINVRKAGLALALLAALGVSAAQRAHAGAVIGGFNANTLAANDDGSAPETALGFTANYFGTDYTTTFVNNNGNTTFGQRFGTYTPSALNGPTSVPIIAPFFADVDTNGAGSGLVTYGTGTVDGHAAFGVESPAVGYYGSHTDKLNTFEEILISRPDTGAGNFDIEYNYNQIQWETGDASGGHGGLGGRSAAVGFSNGSGDPGTNYQLDGSLVNGALIDGGPNALISHDLNSTVLGRYIFQVRGGGIIVPTVPEPSQTAALGLGALGLMGLMAFARKRRASSAV